MASVELVGEQQPGSRSWDGQLGGLSLGGSVDAKKPTLALQGKLEDFKLTGLPGLPQGRAPGRLRCWK